MNLRLSGALCFIALTVPGAANAQERGLEFVPIVGLYNPLTDLRDPISSDLGPLDFGIRQQPAFAFGARTTFWLRGPFGLEGSFLWALSDAERVVLRQRNTADAYVWNASARIMIRLSGTRDPIEFFVNGGLAWTGRGGDAYADFSDTTDFGGVVGASARFDLGGRLALRLDAENFFYDLDLTFRDPTEGPIALDSQFQSDLVLTAGLVVDFGQ